METININRKEYQEVNTREHSSIVIVPNGWIFVGKIEETQDIDRVVIHGASIVRKWSNGKGIGGLRKEENKNEYTLDDAGKVTIPYENINAIIDCEW